MSSGFSTSMPYPQQSLTRVAVTYRVVQHWRAPIFRMLNERLGNGLKVFHGGDVPGTKLINGKNLHGFAHEEMKAYNITVRTANGDAPLVFAPSVFVRLIRYDPDVIVAEGGSNVATNVAVFAYATLFRKPIVWWTLGALPGRKFAGLGKLYRRIVVAMEKRADALLGYSSVALEYFDRMKYPREKCFRAVNCVDTDRIDQGLEQDRIAAAKLRARLNLHDRFVVLFVGALTAPKRVHRLLRAFGKARSRHPQLALLIVGDGPDRARLERLASELGLGDNVKFTGEVVDDVGAYYELGDVFVLPGLGGLAISEAMAHGIPVICGRGDGCEVDLVRHGSTGYRFDTDVDEAVEACIEQALDDLLSASERAAELGTAARRVIDEEHNVRSYLGNVVRAIEYAHARRGRRPS